MSAAPIDIDVLVRSFRAAWNHYFQNGRIAPLSEDETRSALAGFLTAQMRQGISGESDLTVAGVQFLFSLEGEPDERAEAPPKDPVEKPVRWSMHLNSVTAQFLPVRRVRWEKLVGLT